ncbi:hypothetical protein J6590_045578 [Homalodisca vitripennis]|nr:hypothetical protein J6590_045578 [Homalodisca vitripennis]
MRGMDSKHPITATRLNSYQCEATHPPAFVPAFDEIVVESSLTVRGRSGPTSPTQRQGRTRLLVVPTPGTPLNSTSLSANTTDPTTTTTTTTVSTTTSSTTTSTTEKS